MDCSTPSLPIPHYLQEFAQVHVHWVSDAIQPLPISKVKYLNLSFMYSVYGGDLVSQLCLTLATLWTVAHRAPLSMGFLGQESWSGLPFPSPENLPDPGIKPTCPALAGKFYHWATREALLLTGSLIQDKLVSLTASFSSCSRWKEQYLACWIVDWSKNAQCESCEFQFYLGIYWGL